MPVSIPDVMRCAAPRNLELHLLFSIEQINSWPGAIMAEDTLQGALVARALPRDSC
jgi:hypothetical protein